MELKKTLSEAGRKELRVWLVAFLLLWTFSVVAGFHEDCVEIHEECVESGMAEETE